MTLTLQRTRILERIRAGELTAADGLRQLEALAAEPSPTARSVAARALRLHRPGTLDDLQLEPIDVAAPGPGQVRVDVRAFSLNFGDLMCVSGLYPTMPPYPFTPGFELAGVITDVGPGVEALAPGDEVFALMGQDMGAHATAVLVDARAVARKPPDVSHEEACAFPIVYLTAEHALERAALRPGESILIQSAAGGVGLVAVQLALRIGAEVYATAGSAAKLEHLRTRGVRHRINYREDDFAARVRALRGGHGVDVVLDTLAGDALQRGLDLLAPGGRYLEIAVAGLKSAPRIDLGHLVDNQSFLSIDLRRLLLRDPAAATRALGRVAEALRAREVHPTVGHVVPFADIRAAYDLLRRRDNIGKVVVRVDPRAATASVLPPITDRTAPATASSPPAAPAAPSQPSPLTDHAPTDRPPTFPPIAVIGMAGRFPDADDLDEFWANLASGHDAVREIPRERWDVRLWVDPDPDNLERTYCRWGGVLRDVDRFDPHFFHMSRREAELCEPQQRLFLEEAYKALEDAGYAGDRASGLACGVFVGVAVGDYTKILEQAGAASAPQAMTGNETSIVPARIAHLLNLSGPALAVNTACSSSLVAVHLACESLWLGETRMALAGGVFVTLTPTFHVLTSNARMLSPTGRCRAFADDADGFVPGEGVGAVVLKRLADAERDGDRILAVIRASGTNQDGRTSSITAPSARAQADLLRTVHARAGVSPRSLAYVETHGTGTRLGDPVELHALTDAFRAATPDTAFCAVGSVKSSIGHASTAAGVASLIKVLLALRHAAIPPTLHVDRENRHIDFAASPFYVARALRPWPRDAGPRRAAVSSFGFSGTNAHLVVEEPPPPPLRDAAPPAPAWLLPLSARDPAALDRAAAALLRWSRGPGRAVPLADIAFTLQRRRPHFDHRLAVVAADHDELAQALEAHARQAKHDRLVRAAGKDARAFPHLLALAGQQLAAAIAAATTPEAHADALLSWAEHFVAGGAPPWDRLPAGRMAALPAYPFARERCWPDPAADRRPAFDLAADPARGLRSGDQAFRVRIPADDPVLADHRIAGDLLLPGVAALELALAAGAQLLPDQPLALEQVYWLRPLIAGPDGLALHVIVTLDQDGLAFRIEQGDADPTLHVRGHLRRVTEPPPPTLALPDSLRDAITPDHAPRTTPRDPDSLHADRRDGAAHYARLRRSGIAYGPWFQCLRELRRADGEALARLELPQDRRGELTRYRLHPALADAALQAIAGLADRDTGTPAAAFSLDRLTVVERLSASVLAHVREIEPGLFDVTLADLTGRVQAVLSGVAVRPLAPAAEAPAYAPRWQPVQDSVPAPDGPTLALDDQDALATLLAAPPPPRLRVLATEPRGAPPHQLPLALTALVQALHRHGWHEHPLDLLIVTHAAQHVPGDAEPTTPSHRPDAARPDEPAAPERRDTLVYTLPLGAAALPGLVAVLASEHPRWRVHCLDTDDLAPHAWRLPPAPLPGRVACRLAQRAGTLLRQTLLPVEWPADLPSPYRDEGVYLIVGGAGTIGLDLSLALARRHRARLVWLGRGPLDADRRARVARVEAEGGRVLYLAADVRDPAAIAAAIAETRAHFGALHGVVHAALAYHRTPLADEQPDTFRAAFDPKADGARTLLHALRDTPLDFVAFFASIQALVGDVGQAAYAAGCAVQDLLADILDGRAPWPVRAIDWGYWGSGATADPGNQDRLSALGYRVLPPDVGLAALARLLAVDLARVVVVRADPDVQRTLGVDPIDRLVPPHRTLALLAARRPALQALAAAPLPGPTAAEQALWDDHVFSALHALVNRLGLAIHPHHDLEAPALDPATIHPHHDLAHRLRIAPIYGPLFAALLALLARRGLLLAHGADLVLRPADPIPPPALPGLGPHRRLLAACLAAAPAILRDELPATDVLFPGGSLHLVEPVYRDNPVADGLNLLLAQAVLDHVRARLADDPTRTIRILEIGAGTGGSTAPLLAALTPHADRLVYTYTDVSTAFLDHGQARFAAVPHLRFARLDIARDPAGQGLAPGTEDLVIAANVLHAAPRIRDAVRHARSLLRPGGWLVLGEVTRVEPFTTLTFGLLRGWWAFEDPADRLPGGPILDVPRWRRVLAGAGFRDTLALGGAGQHVLIAETDGLEIRHDTPPPPLQEPRPDPRPASPEAPRPTSTRPLVTRAVAEALKLDPHELDPERAFAEYGLDSLTGVELVTRLGRELRTRLRTTILYDHGNLDALIAHLDTLPDLHLPPPRTAPPPIPPQHATATLTRPSPAASPSRAHHAEPHSLATSPSPAQHTATATPAAPSPVAAPTDAPSRARDMAIAIIGMSGRYPGAADLDAYFRLLADGRCAVRDIPPDRWPLPGFHDPTPGRKDRSYCRVGGFLDGVDRFDPAFFRISRAEAAQTDPQQRLFLQEAWRTIEDAGYTMERLARSDCGVIAGGLDGDYQTRLIQAGAREPQALWGNDGSVIAARVAYFLDLRGPSIVLNTACSSSLTAIHLACQRILAGESELMLAGGSFLLSPTFFKFASEVGMLSPTGACRAFDDRADGFIPGEGVGLVLLKSLDAALRDGDVVHGVIRASGINQDGRTNGITAPSAASQTALERRVHRDHAIDPGTISYVEAHGTGTKLGDPIEVAALTDAFRDVDPGRTIPIGSVKPNIGHLAIAAGIAGVHKILLAMRHRVLLPSIHYETPNQHIDFTAGPFRVQTACTAWDPPAGAPRRAAISGFGMSGTNAHLVIDEPPADHLRRAPARPLYLFPFSARTPAALDRLLARFADHLATASPDLAANIAWTLQFGRTPLPARAAFLAADLVDLRRRIERLRSGDPTAAAATRDLRQDPASDPGPASDLAPLCEHLAHETDPDRLREALQTLAAAFVAGRPIPWDRLHPAPPPSRLPLPGQVLEQLRCWIPDPPATNPTTTSPPATTTPTTPQLTTNPPAAPLRDTNPSADPQTDRLLLERIGDDPPRIETRLTPDASFLDDHRVHGVRVLPGAAYLEFARAAGERLTGRAPTGIRDLTWARPLTLADAPATITFAWRTHHAEGAFEILGGPAERPQLHATGRLVWDLPPALPALDLAAVRARCVPVATGDALYQRFAALGLRYGASFQVVRELAAGRDEALAYLEPTRAHDPALHLVPALVDGALQALIGLAAPAAAGDVPFVPFMLEALDIHGPVRGACHVHLVREPSDRADRQRFTLRLHAADGRPCAVLRGLHVRPMPVRPGPPASDLMFCRPTWEPAPSHPGPLPAGVIILLGHHEAERDALRDRLRHPVLLVTPDDPIDPSRWPDIGAVVSLWPDRADDLDARAVAGPAFRLLRALIDAGLPRRGDRLPVLFGFREATDRVRVAQRALGGFLRSARRERPGLDLRLVRITAADPSTWIDHLAAELTLADGEPDIVRDPTRLARRLISIPSPPRMPMRPSGVYLISGGLGGLGLAFAASLAATCHARLVLAGRRPPDARAEAAIAALRQAGSDVLVHPADLTIRGDVDALVAAARRRFGAIHGVLHAAGVTRDATLARKSPEQIADVLAPKVDGILHLDAALADEPLEWMVLCASLAGLLGNPGQADYAYANAWLDAFAEARERQRRRGLRHGITRAIDWPMWQVGMQADAQTATLLTRTLGLAPLTPETGCAALYQALAADTPTLAPLAGDRARLRRTLGVLDPAAPKVSPAASAQPSEPAPPPPDPTRPDETAALVLRTVAEILQLAPGDVTIDDDFSELGFDSLSLTTLANRLNEACRAELTPADLFEHQNLRALARSLAPSVDPPRPQPASPTPAPTDADPTPAHDPSPRTPPPAHAAAIGQHLRSVVASILGLADAEVGLADDLSEFGFDSLSLTELANRLNASLDSELTPAVLFEYPSLAALADALAAAPADLSLRPAPASSTDLSHQPASPATDLSHQPAPAPATDLSHPPASPPAPSSRPARRAPAPDDPIAIVGMAGVMPGSSDLGAFWDHLAAGDDLVTEVPPDRWDWRAIWGDPAREDNRTNVRWGGFMPDVDRFDPLFFGISPREAEMMDPQQRRFLQAVWHCIEDAGHRPSALAGTRTALFVGVAGLDYSELVKQHTTSVGAHNSTGMSHSILANRISYLLDLRGPSAPVDTACSSSLVALRHAVDAIRGGLADMAIAGGVNALLSPTMFIAFSKGGMLSPTGRCSTFDDAADGYVRGEGVGAVLLKPLSRALADGDTVHGLVRAVHVNHGGRANSLTAPNPNAQRELLVDVWRASGISPATVGYIEAHGTGTRLGDPIEVNALKKAFAELYHLHGLPPPERPVTGLGSVKTNIGHLETAAGVAGLIKVLLAMRHGQLPASLHFRALNRYLDLRGTPFAVVDRARPWPRLHDADGRLLPRRAGVSSFGFGGVNAHVVLEEHLEERADPPARDPHLVVLSARTAAALRRQADDLRRWLARHPDASLARVAYTLLAGREPFSERLALIVPSLADLDHALADWLAGTGPALHGSLGPGRPLTPDPAPADPTDRHALARAWVSGATLDPARLYPDPHPQRLSLPGYPFARDRHWIPVPPPAATTSPIVAPAPAAAPATEPQPGDPLANFFYLPHMRRIEPPTAAPIAGPWWLVAVDPHDPLVRDLAATSPDVTVLPAAAFTRPDAAEPLRAVPPPTRVLFLGAGARACELAGPDLADQATARVVALHALVRHLLALGPARAPQLFTLCTLGVHAVLPGEATVPHDAGLHGLAGSFAREAPAIRVQLVDLAAAPSAADLAALALTSAAGSWALRCGAWHHQVALPIALPAAPAPLRDGGAYVILGGTGGLGRTLARALCTDHRARVALLGRRAPDPRLAAEIADGTGGSVLSLQCDTSRPGSVRAAVDAARRAFGRLDGVVHSALDLCDETLERMDVATLRRALSPKVHGAVELAEACADQPLDFFLFFSSGQSFSTDAGQANYAAACTFKDAYARALAERGGFPVRIVNWGYWGTVGAVADAHYRRRMEALGIGAITPAEGLAAIDRVLACPIRQVLALKADERLLRRMGIDPTRRVRLLDRAPAPDPRHLASASNPQPATDLAPSPNPRLVPADLARGRAAADALTRHAHALLARTLRRIGALPAPGVVLDPTATRDALGIQPAHHRLWSALHHILERAGLLARRPVGLVAAPMLATCERALEQEDPAREFPEVAAHLRLLATCLDAYPDVLTGARTAPEVLFPGGSMALVEGIYRGDRLTDHANRQVAAAVLSAVQRLREHDPRARVRILEIGAGTGGTTTFVLDALRPHATAVEYLYTDLSAGFVRHGERTFAAAHPHVSFRVLDVEQPPPRALGAFDVVLAANVVHATRDLERTLRAIKSLMRPAGRLVLLEATRAQDFATLTFGLTDGWWLFEDPRWRLPHAPLLDPPRWRGLLHQEGFTDLQVLGLPGLADDEQVQSVILGASDGLVEDRADVPAADPTPAPVPAPLAAGPLLAWLQGRLGHALKLPPADLDPRATFELYGVDSLVGMEVVRDLERALGPLPSTLLFENPTLERLAATLLADFPAQVQRLQPAPERPDPQSSIPATAASRPVDARASSPTDTRPSDAHSDPTTDTARPNPSDPTAAHSSATASRPVDAHASSPPSDVPRAVAERFTEAELDALLDRLRRAGGPA